MPSVVCWSLSFYPQPLANYRRGSISGLSLDFPLINVLGFLAYGVSTAAFLLSPTIRHQYAVRNPTSPEPTVRGNDLAFALHAVVLSTLYVSQFFCWGYKRERGQRVSGAIAGIMMGCVLSVSTMALIVGLGAGAKRGWEWIDVVCDTSPASARRGRQHRMLTWSSGVDLRSGLCQASHHGREVHPAGVGEL